MKEYEPEALKKLCEYIRKNEDAGKWLRENGNRELAEFWDACSVNMESSFQWLKNNGFVHFAALVDAYNAKEQAKVWLIKNRFLMFAAFVDACDGNKTAVAWLIKNDYADWLMVAKEIYFFLKKKEKRSFGGMFDFGNPYK